MSNEYRRRRVRRANCLSQADCARLLSRCSQGDESAFDLLYGHLWRDVLAFARHLAKCKPDAEDAASETMLAVWMQAASFEGKSRVETWVIGIVNNKVSSMNRKFRRHREVMDPLLLEDLAFDGDNAEEQLVKQQQISQVKAALSGTCQ